ncbi:unnamed protein product [Caenorhabditis sp. 36 PRJEB53466]|nr:unnamed protein product [Caenorhabditis sp. 36 PRJEB53466]
MNNFPANQPISPEFWQFLLACQQARDVRLPQTPALFPPVLNPVGPTNYLPPYLPPLPPTSAPLFAPTPASFSCPPAPSAPAPTSCCCPPQPPTPAASQPPQKQEKRIKTEEIDEKSAETEPDIEFVMGQIPNEDFMPTHHMRGTLLQIPNGPVKRVEDLSSDDFLKCAGESEDVLVNASIVKSITITSPGSAILVFETGLERAQIPLKCQIEHPFFVIGRGWCSCSPPKCGESYGLDCSMLEIGDVCIVLTRPDDAITRNAIDILTAERDLEHFSTRARIREQLAECYYEHVSGRISAPPERIVSHPPTSHRQRKISE